MTRWLWRDRSLPDYVIGVREQGVSVPHYGSEPGDPRRVVYGVYRNRDCFPTYGQPGRLRFCIRGVPQSDGSRLHRVEDHVTGQRTTLMSREMAYWTAEQLDAAFVRLVGGGEEVDIV